MLVQIRRKSLSIRQKQTIYLKIFRLWLPPDVGQRSLAEDLRYSLNLVRDLQP